VKGEGKRGSLHSVASSRRSEGITAFNKIKGSIQTAGFRNVKVTDVIKTKEAKISSPNQKSRFSETI